MLIEYIIVITIAFLLNIMPVFTPPTWTILAFFHIHWGLEGWILALGGAFAAMFGRIILANISSWVVQFFSKKYQANVNYLRDFLEKRARAVTGFALFYAAALPVSSSQFFIAVGLTKLNLWLIAPAFFIGRLASYTLLIYGTGLAASRLEEIFIRYYSNWLLVPVEILSILLLWFLVKIDWKALFEMKRFRLK